MGQVLEMKDLSVWEEQPGVLRIQSAHLQHLQNLPALHLVGRKFFVQLWLPLCLISNISATYYTGCLRREFTEKWGVWDNFVEEVIFDLSFERG